MLSTYSIDQCPYKACGKKFKYRSSLAHHVKIHKHKKEYKCMFCPKEFTTKGNKTEHERRHLTMKLFMCTKCNRRFYRIGPNKNHVIYCGGKIVRMAP